MPPGHPPHPAPRPEFDPRAEILLRLQRAGESRRAALERLARLCACCHRVYLEERLTQHVCERCRTHVRCGQCDGAFDPGPESFALLCPQCWPAQRQLARTIHEKAPSAERAELSHQLQLAFEPRSACRWRQDGRAMPEEPEEPEAKVG